MLVVEAELGFNRPRNRRRDRFTVCLDILKCCVKPISPTRLMHMTNTSWLAFRSRLTELIDQGLVEEIPTQENERVFYVATEKALKLLRGLNDSGVAQLLKFYHLN
jgi:predicted transcriptional regulator